VSTDGPVRRAALRRLQHILPAAFLLVCAEAIVSVLARWPYQFTGPGDPDHMLRDFVLHGTLLSPPLPILLLFGAAATLIWRRDRPGGLPIAILCAICALMSIGAMGEALAPSSPNVPYLLQVSSGFLGAAAFVCLFALSLSAGRQGLSRADPSRPSARRG
jgi:hypothetical protein